MKIKAVIALALLVALAIYMGRRHWLRHDSHATSNVDRPAATRSSRPVLSPVTVETAHYTIASTAAPAHTARVAEVVESLYGAYTTFFRESLAIDPTQAKLKLVLYKDQREFKAHNRSSPWAEAFYLAPRCHAYYADGHANPYHWMVHEATHQLNNEVAHFRRATWVDEGLASYFGASQVQERTLSPGAIDINTYPIWWLSSMALTGVLQDDIRNGRIIPLRDLLASGRGDISRNVNLHYIGFWSLTHFLFHYQNGRYASRYKQLIAEGGSLENFERLVGPVDILQVEWYGYLQQKITEVSVRPGDDHVVLIHGEN
ncbi:MAG: DUF1570 domain-containing protein [Lysobacter sp.]